MPSGPRQLLEQRLADVSTELETIFETAVSEACRDQAEQLNQAVRRLRIAPDEGELCATLAGAVSRFAAGAIVFRLAGGVAASESISVPLDDAPALAASAQSEDPLIVAATPGEVSAPLVELHPAESRAAIFPVRGANGTGALVYCWGNVQVPAVELLAQVASAVWSAFPAPEPPAQQLVTIAPAPVEELAPLGDVAHSQVPGSIEDLAPLGELAHLHVPAPLEDLSHLSAAAGDLWPAPETEQKAVMKPPPEPPKVKPIIWEDLMSSEQQIHLRAQRIARVRAAEIRLHHPELVRAGRLRGNLYDALREQIDSARQAFREEFFTACPSMVDYLHLELTRTLANDDPDLLGSNYPGPLL
ncbi:MAG: hypothetical protein ABI759_25800 [Candidatus Solibacter sp.]